MGVVGMTICDMCVLVLAALRLATPGGCPQERIRPLVAMARSIKKLSMLDVSIMGVVVVVMSLKSLRAKGVIISIQYGLFLLFAAEICHYVAFRLVTNAASTLAEDEKCGAGNQAVVIAKYETSAVRSEADVS